jgi:hypothetical protein
MNRKLNQTERNAKDICGNISAEGHGTFRLRWTRGGMYGRQIHAEVGNTTVARTCGCGYDKLSTAIADFLRFLVPNVWQCGGTGYSTVANELERNGWTLERIYNGKDEDGYKISRSVNMPMPSAEIVVK